MNEPNAVRSIIRGLMPWLISVVIATGLHFGWHLTPVTAMKVLVLVGAVLTVVLHAAEAKWPWVGAALGWLGAPTYPPSQKASLKAQVAVQAAQIAQLTASVASAAPSPGAQVAASPAAPLAPPADAAAPAPPSQVTAPVPGQPG